MSGALLISPLDDNGTRRITLNRPDKANSIDAELGDMLLSALQDASSDGTRFLVLQANGKNFSAGFNFSGCERSSEGDLLLRLVRIEQALQLLWDGPFVSIARVNNTAFGAGADLVAACTFRIGTPQCQFRFPGYRFGVALGTHRLANVVTQQIARHILLTNRTLDGRGALECGLLTHLVAEGQLDREINDLLEGILELEAPSIARILSNSQQGSDLADRDLANLVRSAARPGLHGRINQYAASVNQRRESQP